MLASKITVLGKTIPVWLASLALVAATAGAATGVVLAGNVNGEIVTTVDQSLLVRSTDAVKGTIGGTDAVAAQFNAVSDDGTRFTAATEIMTGEGVTIRAVASNRSTDTIAVSIKLDLLPGITADIDGADGAGTAINNLGDSCVRMSLSEWKCKLASNSVATSNSTLGNGDGSGGPNATADYKIKLALNDETPPGFYTTGVTMTQIENKS